MACRLMLRALPISRKHPLSGEQLTGKRSVINWWWKVVSRNYRAPPICDRHCGPLMALKCRALSFRVFPVHCHCKHLKCARRTHTRFISCEQSERSIRRTHSPCSGNANTVCVMITDASSRSVRSVLAQNGCAAEL